MYSELWFSSITLKRMQRDKYAWSLEKTDDWSNNRMKEFIHIKIPAFEAKVSQNSRFWIYAGYASKTCLKAALVDTPNFKKRHFVLKTSLSFWSHSSFFFNLYRLSQPCLNFSPFTYMAKCQRLIFYSKGRDC